MCTNIYLSVKSNTIRCVSILIILRVKIIVVGDCPLALLGVDDKGIGSSGVSGEAARAGSGDAARQLTLTDQLQADQL